MTIQPCLAINSVTLKGERKRNKRVFPFDKSSRLVCDHSEKNPISQMDSSSSSSSSSTSSIHLAMAAFVGASLMAISAFYIHKRSVDQVLERLIELRRNAQGGRFEEEEEEDGGGDDVDEDGGGGFGSDEEMVVVGRGLSRSVDDNFLRSFRMSSSLPNVAFGNNGWMEDDVKVDRLPNFRPRFSSSLNNIPSVLPPLRTDQRRGIGLQKFLPKDCKFSVLLHSGHVGMAPFVEITVLVFLTCPKKFNQNIGIS